MVDQTDIQSLLQTLLGVNVHVYFQPPPSVSMIYPCVIYERSNGNTKFADNNPYATSIRYTVTLIDRNPNSSLIGALMGLPRCVYDRHFTADNLNHDVFSVYF